MFGVAAVHHLRSPARSGRGRRPLIANGPGRGVGR